MSKATSANASAVIAAALGIVGLITRPFLFFPIGLFFLLASAKFSEERRLTAAVASFLAICAIAGAAIAAGFDKPLY